METLGYDESHFARRVGVSSGALTNVVRNNEDPSYALLRNMCTVFPVSERWLMIGEGKPWTDANINKWKMGSTDKSERIVKEINQRLKEFRVQTGLSQTLFASELGVTRDVICNIETYRASPSVPMVIEAAKVFNMNANWLLFGEGEMKKG